MGEAATPAAVKPKLAPFKLSAEVGVMPEKPPVADPNLKDQPPGEGQKCKSSDVDPTLDAVDKALEDVTNKMEKFGGALIKHVMDGQEFLDVTNKATAQNAKVMEEMWTKDPYGGAKQAALPVAGFAGGAAWNAFKSGIAANATRAGTVPGVGGGAAIPKNPGGNPGPITGPPPLTSGQNPVGNSGPPLSSGGRQPPPRSDPGALGSGPPPLSSGTPQTGAMNVSLQEFGNSCGPASIGMVYEKVFGTKIPESVVRNLSQRFPGGYQPATGTYMQNLRDTMRDMGLNAQLSETVVLDDLAQVTATGRPAIAQIHWPNGGAHAIVVDSVSAGPVGSRTVWVRDPLMPSQGPQPWPERAFNQLFNPPQPATGAPTYGTAVGIF